MDEEFRKQGTMRSRGCCKFLKKFQILYKEHSNFQLYFAQKFLEQNFQGLLYFYHKKSVSLQVVRHNFYFY